MPPRSSALGSIVEETPDTVSQDLLKSHTCPGCSQPWLSKVWVLGLAIPSGCRTLLTQDFGSRSLHCMTRIVLELSFTLHLILSSTLLSPFPFLGPTCIMVWGFSLSIPLLPTSSLWHLLIRGPNWLQSLYFIHLNLTLNAFGIKLFFHLPLLFLWSTLAISSNLSSILLNFLFICV